MSAYFDPSLPPLPLPPLPLLPLLPLPSPPLSSPPSLPLLPSPSLPQENERSKDVIIPQAFHKLIIGTKGEKIREIRDRFNGVQVAFPEHGQKSDVVTLRGPREDVDKCATHLKKMVADLVGRVSRHGQIDLSVGCGYM